MPFIKLRGVPQYKGSGIYKIVNLVNSKVYVGSAQCIKVRLEAHKASLKRGQHDNQHLLRAWQKYGEANFSFEVIQICSKEVLTHNEQFWINLFEACDRSKGYNICPIAGAAMAGRKHSNESKLKMSSRRKGVKPIAATLAAAKANKGKPRSEEVRRKISAAQRGKPKSAEHKENTKLHHWCHRPDAKEIAEKSACKNRGKNLSTVHKKKISEGVLRRNQGGDELSGYTSGTPKIVQAIEQTDQLLEE